MLILRCTEGKTRLVTMKEWTILAGPLSPLKIVFCSEPCQPLHYLVPLDDRNGQASTAGQWWLNECVLHQFTQIRVLLLLLLWPSCPKCPTSTTETTFKAFKANSKTNFSLVDGGLLASPSSHPQLRCSTYAAVFISHATLFHVYWAHCKVGMIP